MRKTHVPLIIALSLYAAIPLVQPYFFASDDGAYHIFRLMQLDRAIRDGAFYPRWAPDFFFGYGFPIFNYYAPLTYYAGEVFHLLGLGYIDSIKALIVASMALSGMAAYLYAADFLSPKAALLVGLLYLYAPYHLVDLYVRGDIAQLMAYLWFPLILFCFSRLLSRPSWAYLTPAALAYAGLILTHNVLALLFSPFLLAYCLLFSLASPLRQQQGIHTPLMKATSALLLAYGLSAFYWLPALAEQGFVHVERLRYYDFHEEFLGLGKLLSLEPIQRYASGLLGAEVPRYQLGLIQTILAGLGSVMLLWRWKSLRARARAEGLFALLSFLFALFLTLPFSSWFWESLPLIALIQFPWRFLALMVLPSALLGGLLLEMLGSRWRGIAFAALVPLILISSLWGLHPSQTNLSEAQVTPGGSIALELAYNVLGTTSTHEYVPIWVKEEPVISPLAVAALRDVSPPPLHPTTQPPSTQADFLERKATSAAYRLRALEPTKVVFNTLYFPGWRARVDGKEAEVAASEPEGLISLSLPAGEHRVELRFGETPLRLAADLLSFISLAPFLFAASRLSLLRRGIPIRQDARLARHLPRKGLLRAGAWASLMILFWLLLWRAHLAHYQPPGPYQAMAQAEVDRRLVLLGYDLKGSKLDMGSSPRAAPGSNLELTLHWRILSGLDSSASPPRLFARLSGGGATWSYIEEELYAAQRPPEAGATISKKLQIPIPSGLPPRFYYLQVGVLSSGGELLPITRYQAAPVLLLPLEEGLYTIPINVAGDAGSSAESTGGGTDFADVMLLRDFQVMGSPRAGETLRLSLLWQAKEELRRDYKVTARLVDPSGFLYAVRDASPAGGLYPTYLWRSGELVRGQLELRIPPETPPGPYSLQLEVISSKGPLSILDERGAPRGPTLTLTQLQLAPSLTRPNLEKTDFLLLPQGPQAEGLQLLGYKLGGKETRPGDSLHLELLWGATRSMQRDLWARIRLVDEAGRQQAELLTRPVGDAYATPQWLPEQILRGQYRIPLRASIATGSLSLQVGIEEKGTPLASATLDQIMVEGRPHRFEPPQITYPIRRDFGEKMRLLGYYLSPGQAPLPSGRPFQLSLWWQALGEMGTSYAVSVQLLDEAGRLVAQHDSPPQRGEAPTTSWLEGEFVQDEHQIELLRGLPQGSYTLLLVVYDPKTGARLRTTEGEDYLRLGMVYVAD